jgi:hypothetical protein
MRDVNSPEGQLAFRLARATQTTLSFLTGAARPDAGA